MNIGDCSRATNFEGAKTELRSRSDVVCDVIVSSITPVRAKTLIVISKYSKTIFARLLYFKQKSSLSLSVFSYSSSTLLPYCSL